MEYTLLDFLQSDITPPVKLLTKKRDFSRVHIEGVSVQEFPIDDFIRKGELVLSTAIGCQKEESTFLELIRAVGKAKAATMLLAFKDKTYSVPPGVIAYADSIGLPLFLLPWEYRFSVIQEAVIHGIQEKKLSTYKELQAALFNTFFDSQPIEKAVEQIAKSFQAPVFVSDLAHRILAGQDVQDKPEQGFCESEIYINDAPVGYLCLYAPQKQDVTDLIEKYVCFPLSLWFNRKNIEDMMSVRLKNDFVWNLANQNYTSLADMVGQGLRLHFNLSRPYTCVILKAVAHTENMPVEEYSARTAATASEIETVLIQAGQKRRLGVMVASRSLEFIIYLENPQTEPTESVERFLDELELQLSHMFPAYAFYWGISEITRKAPDFHQLYKNASLALRYCLNSGRQRYRSTYQDTREAQIVSALSENEKIQKLAREVIGTLQEHDTGSSIDLVGTLITFIKCNYNTCLTARTLHIHRQSLLYRLGKIEALTEMSLNNHQNLFLLEISTRLLLHY